MKLESIEHARFRALAQILINQEAGGKAFDEYLELAFPYMGVAKKRDKSTAIDAMKKWVGGGPLQVQALPQPTLRSKLKKRQTARRELTREQENALYEKFGQSIPIR
jgi:hypothetical protein